MEGSLVGIGISEYVARICPTRLKFQFLKGICDRIHIRDVTYRAF